MFEKRALREGHLKLEQKFYKLQHFPACSRTCEDRDFSDVILVREVCNYIELDAVILSARNKRCGEKRGKEFIPIITSLQRFPVGFLGRKNMGIYSSDGKQA